MYSISAGLRDISNWNGSSEAPHISQGFYLPGYWATVTAWARSQALDPSIFTFAKNANRTYTSAIGFARALGHEDDFVYTRSGQGRNYSPLVVLDSTEATDCATQDVTSCVRSFWPEGQSKFVDTVCNVIGDLHDNVWSHGQSTGISVAQRWQVPYSPNDHYLEFALADCGIGFLGELKRAGLSNSLSIDSHRDAVTWCVQEGNSSKKILDDASDDWAQQVPGDFMALPGGGSLSVRRSTGGNHHQGLGLAKLTSLVMKYSGELSLVSGDARLYISEKGRQSFLSPDFHWQGVTICARFKESRISEAIEAPEQSAAPRLQGILNRLRHTNGQ